MPDFPSTAPPTPNPMSPDEPQATVEEQADQIEAHSPEGRPADPTLRGPGMLRWLMLGVVVIAFGAIIVGATQGLAAGIVVLVFALGLGVIVNPEIWAAMLRAKERREVDKEAQHSPNGP